MQTIAMLTSEINLNTFTAHSLLVLLVMVSVFITMIANFLTNDPSHLIHGVLLCGWSVVKWMDNGKFDLTDPLYRIDFIMNVLTSDLFTIIFCGYVLGYTIVFGFIARPGKRQR